MIKTGAVCSNTDTNEPLAASKHTHANTHTYTLHFVGGGQSSPLIYPVKKNVLLKIIT